MMAAAFAGTLIRFRHKLGTRRKAVVWGIIGFHLAMETQGKPVWHMLARVDLVGGSTGYHRYYLVDQWIRRVLEWGPLGVKGTAHWGWGLADVTNQYVLESVRGGIWTLVVFVWMIATAFKYQGTVWRSAEGDGAKLALAWALGVSLFTHCVSFIAVSYFGQINFVWYLHLALISSMYAQTLRQAEAPAPASENLNPIAPPIRRPRRLLGA